MLGILYLKVWKLLPNVFKVERFLCHQESEGLRRIDREVELKPR